MKFEIFEIGKKSYLNENFVVYSLFSIAFIGVLISALTDSKSFETYFQMIIYFNLILIIYFKVTQRSRYERLNEKLLGSIIFQDNQILVLNTVINLTEISKIDFTFINFSGKHNINLRWDLSPALSQGIDNIVKIVLLNGKTFRFNLKLNYENHEKVLKDILIEYMNNDKISVLRVTDILGIKNYNEIQDFKKKYLR